MLCRWIGHHSIGPYISCHWIGPSFYRTVLMSCRWIGHHSIGPYISWHWIGHHSNLYFMSLDWTSFYRTVYNSFDRIFHVIGSDIILSDRVRGSCHCTSYNRVSGSFYKYCLPVGLPVCFSGSILKMAACVEGQHQTA